MKAICTGLLLGLLALTGRAREIQVTILHTADVTGHVLPVAQVSGSAATLSRRKAAITPFTLHPMTAANSGSARTKTPPTPP